MPREQAYRHEASEPSLPHSTPGNVIAHQPHCQSDHPYSTETYPKVKRYSSQHEPKKKEAYSKQKGRSALSRKVGQPGQLQSLPSDCQHQKTSPPQNDLMNRPSPNPEDVTHQPTNRSQSHGHREKR